jgi:hypothetical protein
VSWSQNCRSVRAAVAGFRCRLKSGGSRGLGVGIGIGIGWRLTERRGREAGREAGKLQTIKRISIRTKINITITE